MSTKTKLLAELMKKSAPVGDFFNRKTTDMPFYDELIESLDDEALRDYFKENKGIEASLIDISPDEYMNLVEKGFSGNAMSGVFPEKVTEYAKKMGAGEKFPTLFLDYTRGKKLSQEGRHRALAAKKQGASSVPVLTVKPTHEEAAALGVSLDDINTMLKPYERGFADPRLLAGTAGATGLMAKLIRDSQDDSTVRAPKNPKTAMLATMLRDGERAVKGSPAEFVYPSGLAPWLERLAYNEEPSKLETAMAIADFLP